ncbi:MAG: HAD family hydrolase [Actinobacteria bacterium]|nr:MAG: HAD family hydrolase [Actinomycetota bacterium]
MRAVVVDLAALGDTGPLWRDWLADAGRRFRVDVAALDEQLPNWRQLLERFAEERAPVYLRRDAAATEALRRLHAAGVRIGVFTDMPEELARVALSHLGADGRVTVVETGDDARARLLEHLGADATVVRTRAELLSLR